MKYKDLPVYKKRKEILKALRTNNVIVVESPTGSGKTTGIPIILHEAGYDENSMIGITQPRRIAAMNVTSFIKTCLEIPNDDNTVALKMRFQDDTDSDTKIKIMTDGILLEEFKTDPFLSKYSVIMIDEAHERSLNIDFSLGLLKELLKVREDLKVIISSATINPKEFSTFFDNAPIISINSKCYDVEIKYCPIGSHIRDKNLYQDLKTDTILNIVKNEVEAKSGDILIFLSGESEIKNVYNALKYSSIANKLDIYPLYSRLSKEAQSSVFNKTRRGLTKVVVATNIAETSITIDGITTVIDSGTAKNNYYNNFNNTSSLIEGQISKSNASQRTGRAGRTKNGVCYRLYSCEDFESRSEFPEAEIKRSDLSDVVLRSIDLGIKNAENFPFITPVSTSAIVSAYDTLFTLGAIDKKREITEMGKFMMRFPLSVRHARIVAESVYTYPGALKKVLIAVSFISTRSPFISVTEENEQDIKKAQKKYRTSGGDFLAYLKIFEDWTSYYTSEEKKHFADKHFLDYESMCEIECIERQLEDILSESGIPISDSCTLTEYMLCLSSGLKQYIIKGIGKGLYVGLQGNRVVISPSSMLIKGDYEYLVASEISGTNRLFARGVSPLKAEWISFIGDDVQKAFYTSLKSKPNKKKNAVQEKKSKKKKSEKKRKKSKKRK